MKKIKKIFARGLIFCPSRDLPLEGQKISHLNFDNRIHMFGMNCKIQANSKLLQYKLTELNMK